MINTTLIHPDVEELKELLEPSWNDMLLDLMFSGVPLNAGDTDVDTDTDTDAGGGADDDADDDDADAGSGGGGGDDDDDDDGADPNSVVVNRDEYNRLRRESAEAAKRARTAEREAKKQRERERREAGQHDEIIAEKEEEAAAAAARAEAAEYQLEQFQRRTRINAMASSLGFRDPEDAAHFLDEDETDDDRSTERALKRLAREKPYLVDSKRSSGAPISGERGTTLTHEDIKKMSQDEINARWEEVQAALAAGTA